MRVNTFVYACVPMHIECNHVNGRRIISFNVMNSFDNACVSCLSRAHDNFHHFVRVNFLTRKIMNFFAQPLAPLACACYCSVMTNTEAPAAFRTAADALAFSEALLAEARFRDGRATALVADDESAEYLVELLLAAGVEDVLERRVVDGVVIDVILD